MGRPVDDDEAARLLGRVAGAVWVAPAPVHRLVDSARRARRRRRAWLVLTAVLAVLLLLVLAA
jgi:hypothetical protein